MQRIKKGDTVQVIAGKDKGQTGEVIKVLIDDNRVIVNGVNIVKRHQKARPGPSGQQIPAQIVEKDAPLHLSNVMLQCPACKNPVRVGYRVRDDGYKVRVCKKCGKDIE
jgi:large subunit ribosomal protein L24